MLTSAELVRLVLSQTSGHTRVAALRRFLRVPEAWQALRLRACEPAWNPEELSQPLSHFVQRMHADARGKESPGNLNWQSNFSSLESRLASSGANFLEEFLAEPLEWRSVIALRWDSIDNQAGFVAGCLQSDSLAATIALIDILLANLDPGAVPDLLQSISPVPASLLQAARVIGERELTAALSQAASSGQLEFRAPHISADANYMGSVLREPDSSDQASLRRAWDNSARQQALIAELMADRAEADGDLVMSLEALTRSVEAHSTPARRARLAAMLIDAGRWEEAQVALGPEPAEFSELAVQACGYWAQGSRSLAIEAAKLTRRALESSPLQPNRWVHYLVSLLKDLGELGDAQSALADCLTARPSNIDLQIAYAQISNLVGDHSAAEDASAIAGLLEPENSTALRELAVSLQENGKHAKALPIWRELSETDDRARRALVECSLQVGDSESALQVAKALVEREDPTPEEMVLFGRSLLAAGQFRAAKSALERVTEQSPDYAPAWLALTDCLKRNSDPAANDVLPQAVQSCPQSPELQAALAAQLRKAGDTDQALFSAEKAYRLGASQPEFLQTYAALLRDSGDPDRAYELLEQAHKARPADEDLRMSLADMAESREEIEHAYQLIANLTPSGLKEVELKGRLAAKSSQLNGDLETALNAVQLLGQAHEAGEIGVDSQLWLAHSLLFTGQPEDAMRQYSLCSNSLAGDDDPRRIECLRGEAEAAIAAGQIPVAISALELARDSEIADAACLALLAEAYSFAGMYPEALVEAQRALGLAPDVPGYRRIFLETCRATGSWQMGLTQIDSWQASEELDAHIMLDRALFLSRLSRQEEARSAVAHALRFSRRDPDLLSHAQHVLQDMGEWMSAYRILSSLRSVAGLDETLLREFATVSSKAGKLETAAGLWIELAEADPRDSRSLTAAAECLYELGRAEEAIGYWEKALSADPVNSSLHARLARVLLEIERYLPALQHYQKAIQLTDGDAVLTLEAARAHEEHGSLDSADELVRGLLDDQPQHVEARRFLARLLIERQMPQEAEVIIEQDPQVAKSAQGLALLSLAALDRDDPNRAEDLLDQAMEFSPDSLSAIELISKAALQAGRWQVAEDVFSTLELGSSENLDALVLFALVRSRLAEMYWLLVENAKVHVHAPGAETAEAQRVREIEGLLEAADADPTLKKETLDSLQIAFGLKEFDDPVQAELVSLPATGLAWQAESIAIAHLRQCRPEDAIRRLADLPASTRLGDWSPLLAGIAHLQAARPQLALKAFSAVQSPRWKPVAAYMQSRAALKMGEVEQALQALNKAVIEWPTEPAWQRELGELYLSADSPETAVPHLQQASELSVFDPDVDLLLARSLRDAGQLPEAAAAYEKSLAEAASDPSPWREAAQVHAKLGDHARAAELFEQALALDSTDPGSLIGVSSSLRHLGEIARAHEYANLAVRHAPNNPDALTALADILALNSKPEQALELYDEAAQLGTPSYDLHKARSDLLLRIGKPQEAMQALTRAADQDPDDIRVWLAISEVFEIHGDLSSARDAIRQAMTIQPSSPHLKLALARLARKSGQLDQALAELVELQSVTDDDPAVAIEVGRVHQARREFRRALNAFEKATRLAPTNALAHFLSGMVLKEIKAYPRAADCFKKAVELDPKDTDALHQLAAVRALELVHGGMKPSAVTS